jgi:hypothetical protein
MFMLKGKVRSLTAGASALAVAGLVAAGFTLAAGGPAGAAGGGGPVPPWQASINSGTLLGGITFYNAQGQVVTGGSITASGFGAYAVASTPDARTGDDKAGLYIYTPVDGVNPGAFTGESFTAATNYPSTGAPGPIATTTQPYETNKAGGDPTILSWIENDPNTDTSTTDGYAGLYDVRLRASGPGLGIESDYWDTAISVDITQGTIEDPVAGTWSVDYPDYTQSTTTTVSATSPSSGSLDLSATVTPATAAGTVSFWTGYGTSSAAQVGTTQTVSDGTASVTTTAPSSSTTYTAVYTPAIPDSGPGTGNALASYDIGSTGTATYPPAVTTSTTLGVTPPSPVAQGSAVTFTATVTATGSATTPTGTVNFKENGASVGTGSLNGSGVATLTTTKLAPSAPGGASLTATYTPASGTSFGGSTSSAVTYTVNPTAAKPTLSGPGQVGQKETCNEGTLATGVTATYSWLVKGASIGKSSTLTVPASAYNQSLSCKVTVVDGSGPSSSATSASVKVKLGKALTATKAPTLSGSHAIGKTETCKPGTWSQPKVTFTYQWLLNGKVIKGATKSTFKPSKSDKGKKLSCKVTAHLTGYANGSATTKSVKVS